MNDSDYDEIDCNDNNDYVMDESEQDVYDHLSQEHDYNVDSESDQFYDDYGNEDGQDDHIHVDSDDDDDDDDDDDHVSHSSEEEEEESFGRNMTPQQFLDHLRQQIQNNDDGDVENDDGNNRTSHTASGMSLSEVLPELLSMMGNGGSGRRGVENSRRSKFIKLIENVENANIDPYFAMESINELSENLLMMNQIVIDRIIPMDRLLSALTDVLSSPNLSEELELQMQACRCLYNLLEVHPESIAKAVDKGIILTLQGKLHEINYIDLAEQLLETLEFISRICGKDILACGNLTVYLQYLDFFTIHAQRKAIAIVSNACARVHPNDFDTISDVFVTLKPIFINYTDQNILDRILTVLYGVCGGFKDPIMLETLFSRDILEHLIKLISSTDTASDGRLKCLEILSALVAKSSHIAASLIENTDIATMLSKSLHQYSKSPDATLHETIMFVPKSLLTSVSRFIALLFPPEADQILTINRNSEEISFEDTEKVNLLLKNLIPLLTEIFLNSVEFSTRRNVLIGLIRMVPFMNEITAKSLDDSLVKLLSLSLAQTKSLLENDKNQSSEIGSLIIGLLSLLNLLYNQFPSIFLALLKREGVLDTVTSLNSITIDMSENNGMDEEDSPMNATSDEGSTEGQDSGEDSDEDTKYFLDDADIPKEVKPKKIKFIFLKKLQPQFINTKINELCELLLSLLETSNEEHNNNLDAIKKMVSNIRNTSIKKDSFDELCEFWEKVKLCFFGTDFNISGHELITTGLASVLAEILGQFEDDSMFYLKNAMKYVFDTKFIDLANILQTALTRVESFPIVDCGLQGEEGGMASLGKQIKVRLVYGGEEKMFDSVSSIIIVIHCIASFKVLSTFIKDRATKMSFFSWMLPQSSSVGNEGTPAEREIGRDNIDSIRNMKFNFFIDEKPISTKHTLFSAIFKSYREEKKSIQDIWDDVHVIKFMKSENTDNETDTLVEDDVDMEEGRQPLDIIYSADETICNTHGSTYDVLKILKFLRSCTNSNDSFVNSKLSAKLNRQMEEPLIVAGGILPEWSLELTKEYSFLFPFETRMLFLQSTSYGYGRFIQLWKRKVTADKQLNSDDPLLQLGRIARNKILINRDNILLSALKILDEYSNLSTVLEFQYVNEEGTGLGPTLEFYAIVSREFAKKKLNLWRTTNDGDDSDYVSRSLFPLPINAETQDRARIIELFGYLGIFVARSMLDNRIVDFRFNPIFFYLAHKLARKSFDIESQNLEELFDIIAYVDGQLTKSLRFIYDNRDNESTIRDMCLTFVLPGTSVELTKNGQNLEVHSGNATDYIRHIVSYMIGKGIKEQLGAFITGFSKVFPYSNLLILSPEELVDLFGSVEEDWSPEVLYNCIDADHGYTMDSQSIHGLVSIMASFSTTERRSFLQFMTGSPKLPLGGFKQLSPRFTVVLKHAEDGLTPDEYLPSVMTCANYLKLPKYSSKDIMRQRIVQAMEEGAQAFLLS